MKEIEKYIGYYLLVYLVVLSICGFFQYLSACQGKSLSCVVSITGLVNILTVTAYVLTPIVAIIGFLSWKAQHNKLILAEEAKKLLLAINDDIKLFTDILGTLKNRDNDSSIQDVYDEDLSQRIKNLSDNITNISSKALILYELTNDESLDVIRQDYCKFMHGLHVSICTSFKNNTSVWHIIHTLNSNKLIFMQNNKLYKQLVRSYIIA